MASRQILASMAVLISAQTKAFESKLSRSEKKLGGFVKTVGKVGGALGIAFGGRAVLSAFGSAIKRISEFESELSKVRAITGATGRSFDRLRQNALDLGGSTKFTAQQVATLQSEYGKLGFTTREILNATEATLELATATGEDLATSAKVAGATLRGFELDASETARVVDVMAKSFTSSALDLESFSEAMKFVAPVAKAANISIEQTTAFLSTLADAGIKGSQAGTALRRIFSELSKTGKPVAEALKEISERGLDLASAQDEVGRNAQTALLVLSKNVSKSDELAESYRNAAGAAGEMADIIEDNLEGDLTRLSSAFDGLIQRGGVLNPLFRSFTQQATEFVNIINSGNLSFFDKLAALAPGNFGLLNAQTKDIVENARKANEEFRRQQAILSTVNAAFASGNLEAYIKALDQNVNKDEIIAEIRKRQNEEEKKRLEIEQQKTKELEEQRKKLEAQRKEAEKIALAEAKRTKEALAREIQGLSRSLGRADPNDPTIRRDFIGIDISQVNEEMIQLIQPVNQQFKDFTDTVVDGSQLMQQSLANLASGIGQSLADIILNTGSLDQFFKSILAAFGDFVTQFGELLIAYGAAQLAFKQAFANPLGAIAAGAALVAIGSLIKALSQKGPEVPALQTGTNFIPQDGLFALHRGEAVVPKKFNPAAGGGFNQRIQIEPTRIDIPGDFIRIVLERSDKSLNRLQG